MTWATVRITDFATVSSGGGAPQDADAFSHEGTPFVRAGSLIKLLNGHPEDSLELLQPDIAARHKLKLFPAGTVLFAKSGMSATKGHIYQLKKASYVVNHLAALIPHSKVSGDYLRHVLRFKSPTCLIKDEAYPSIRLGEIEDMKIPAPKGESEQQRIAAILDQADELRHKRQCAINRLNYLGQAIFHEMFTAVDRHGWKKASLSTFCDIQVGFAFKSPDYTEDVNAVRLCRGANVLPSRIDWGDTARLPRAIAQHHLEFALREGDIVIAMDRPWISDGFKVARINTSDLPALLVQRVARLRSRDPIDSEFVFYLVNSTDFQKSCHTTETTVPHISPKDIRGYDFLCPPNPLRKEFAAKIAAIRRLNEQADKLLQQSSRLFASLQHRAFQGEL